MMFSKKSQNRILLHSYNTYYITLLFTRIIYFVSLKLRKIVSKTIFRCFWTAFPNQLQFQWVCGHRALLYANGWRILYFHVRRSTRKQAQMRPKTAHCPRPRHTHQCPRQPSLSRTARGTGFSLVCTIHTSDSGWWRRAPPSFPLSLLTAISFNFYLLVFLYLYLRTFSRQATLKPYELYLPNCKPKLFESMVNWQYSK